MFTLSSRRRGFFVSIIDSAHPTYFGVSSGAIPKVTSPAPQLTPKNRSAARWCSGLPTPIHSPRTLRGWLPQRLSPLPRPWLSTQGISLRVFRPGRPRQPKHHPSSADASACERGSAASPYPVAARSARDCKAVRSDAVWLPDYRGSYRVEAFGNVYIIRFVQSAARNRTFVRHEMKMKTVRKFSL